MLVAPESDSSDPTPTREISVNKILDSVTWVAIPRRDEGPHLIAYELKWTDARLTEYRRLAG